MSYKIVSQLSSDGYFIAPAIAHESPLEPGIYLLPRGAVDVAPPELAQDTRAMFTESGWQVEIIEPPVIEVPPEPPKHVDLESPVLHEPEPPTPEQIRAQVESNVRWRLDEFARTRGYDGILSACTYATSTVEKFRTEGQYCVEARDATWTAYYAIMNEVDAGNRAEVTDYVQIENQLPVLTWPNP